MNIVVMAILALIVLVVLSFVFSDQIRTAASSYFGIGKDATDGAQGKKCVTIVSAASHKCISACEEGWEEVFPSGGEWTDCKEKCCEKKA